MTESALIQQQRDQQLLQEQEQEQEQRAGQYLPLVVDCPFQPSTKCKGRECALWDLEAGQPCFLSIAYSLRAVAEDLHSVTRSLDLIVEEMSGGGSGGY